MMLAVMAALLAAHGHLVGDLPRAPDRPLEDTVGLETRYGALRVSDGYRLRTVITRPERATGRLAAIFYVQPVSCGSIEWPAGRTTALRMLAQQSGMAVIRIERAGTGDSEGPPCADLDYLTELRHYREAFDQMAQHEWVDPARIVILGSSLGATLAPLVAQGRPVAGVVVQGGGALTYLERMVNFDRFWFERSGRFDPAEVHDRVLKSIRFNQLYLMGRLTPEEIARAHPDLANVWSSMRGTVEAPPHYGRPHAWHWQAAATNFLAAWMEVTAPVLVLWAEHEQFEPRHSHQMIVDALNARRPGQATFVELEGLDHGLVRYPSTYAAYRDEEGTPAREAWVGAVVGWLTRLGLARSG